MCCLLVDYGASANNDNLNATFCMASVCNCFDIPQSVCNHKFNGPSIHVYMNKHCSYTVTKYVQNEVNLKIISHPLEKQLPSCKHKGKNTDLFLLQSAGTLMQQGKENVQYPLTFITREHDQCSTGKIQCQLVIKASIFFGMAEVFAIIQEQLICCSLD